MFTKSNSIKKYKHHAVMVGPNLGKPQILSFPKDLLEETQYFDVEILYIADAGMDEEQLRLEMEERVQLRPITGLHPEKRRGIRAKGIIAQIKSVDRAPAVPLDDPELVYNYGWESPRVAPVREQLYGPKSKYFLAKVSFKFTDLLKKTIQMKGYILCDLIQSYPEEENLRRTNYHSVCLTNQTWENCTIIQASDLHIAKRNDEVLTFLLRGFDKSLSKRILAVYDFFTGNYKDTIEDRFVNPNNNLRLFIRLMNKLHASGKVDVIIFTGDIIDFCVRSDGGDNVTSFDMQNTNWNIFYKILLNQELTFRSDVNPEYIYPGEELLVPIFTATGNHDYRCYHYDFRWGPLHKVLNVRPLEIMHYNDVVPANPITSLYVNRKTMLAYSQYFNPNQNYYIQLGDHTLLVMDTEYDSAKATKDLFMGGPAARGFSDEQVQFMRNVLKHKPKPRGVRMAFFHAPVINPPPFSFLSRKLRRMYEERGFDDIDDFKEGDLYKKTHGEERRADLYIPFNHGSISTNWDKSLRLLHDSRFYVFNGHTHDFKEFRTEDTDTESEITQSNYFVVRKNVRVPAAIYMDDYTIKYKNSGWFHKNMPFHVQTPSLGVGRYGETNLTGGFRIIKIRDNKMDSFRVDFISNYKKMFSEYKQV